jgi:hypothetical protein
MAQQNWKDIAEIVGIVAIIASLLFVGLQLKQSQDIALAASYQARTTTLAEAFSARAANTQALAAELRVQGRNPDGEVTRLSIEIPESAGVLTELEYRAGLMHALSMWQQWNNIYYQNEMGFMPDGNWLRLRSAIKRNFERQTLASLVYNAFEWSPEFQKEIDEIIAEVDAEKSP